MAVEQLLRAEFKADSLHATDMPPLEFLVNELNAIVQTVPPELAVSVATAKSFQVIINYEV